MCVCTLSNNFCGLHEIYFPFYFKVMHNEVFVLTNEWVKKLKDGQENKAWTTKRSLHDALVGEGAAQMATAHHKN